MYLLRDSGCLVQDQNRSHYQARLGAVVDESDEAQLLRDSIAYVPPLAKYRAPKGNDNAAKARGYKGNGMTIDCETSTAYLAARINRDRPDIAARTNDFGSMAAATKAAGTTIRQR